MEATSPLLAPQKKEMRTLYHLPEDIMMEIILRLPPESLIRFRCVCKSWYAVISDPSFADKHVLFNKNRVASSTSLLLSWYKYEDDAESGSRKYEDVVSLITISDDDDDDDDDNKDNNDHIPCVIEDINLSIILGMPKELFTTASHCNGLTCLCVLPDQVVLYNSTIREFKLLPKPCLGRCVSSVGGLFVVQVEGLGYDWKANDYKFIRILHKFRTKECIAEVYTMSSDSWREIQIDIKVDFFLGLRRGVCCKGVFYWLVMMPHRILSFDLSSGEFHTIRLPDVVEQVEVCSSTQHILAVWNESVALLTSKTKRVPLSIEMWVMDDYHGGVKGSWTKLLTIGPFVSLYHPIMFWKIDELLLDADNGGIVSYNLGTKKFRNLPIHALSPGSCMGDIYMKSLVSVKGRN